MAAGTSLVAVAATSAAGSSTYVRTRLTNIRLAVLLGTATVAAAIGASLVAQAIDGRILRGLFAFLLLYTAVTMIRGARPAAQPAAQAAPAPKEVPAPAPDGWNLGGSYQDARLGQVAYQATRDPLGMGASLLGGTISGLLGVGGGIVQVPVMHRLHHPIYPKDICQVVYQNQQMRNACQFSFACDGIPEVVNDQKAWAQAKDIAKGVIVGNLYVTEVGYATHYHATYVRPDWAGTMQKMQKIGHHIFYQFKRYA